MQQSVFHFKAGACCCSVPFSLDGDVRGRSLSLSQHNIMRSRLSVFGVTVSERPWNSPGPRCCFRKPQSPMKIEKAFLPQQPVFFVVFCFFYFTWRPLQNWEIYAFQAMLEGMAICSQAHLGTSGSDCTQWDPVTGWRGECFSQAVAMFGTLGLCCCPTML